jgi:hypothetical protein
MPLPDKRDHKISLPEAIDLTKRHRKEDPKAGHAEYFHREAFEQLLAQPGCAGIRIYHGKGAKGEHHCVLVGVDDNGSDMTSAGIMEQSLPCPPFCDKDSPLVR